MKRVVLVLLWLPLFVLWVALTLTSVAWVLVVEQPERLVRHLRRHGRDV